MIFTPGTLAGAWVLDPERHEDERGSFARTFCRREFEAHGLNPDIAQSSVSFNRRRGTLRGMHYQAEPFAEAKVVQCGGGAIYDVVLDLRRGAPTYLRWEAFELSARNGRMLYIPEGVAHGFQTLEDGAVVLYQMSEFHAPEHARGVRWDDPAFGIEWPIPHPFLSLRDASYPLWDAAPSGI